MNIEIQPHKAEIATSDAAWYEKEYLLAEIDITFKTVIRDEKGTCEYIHLPEHHKVHATFYNPEDQDSIERILAHLTNTHQGIISKWWWAYSETMINGVHVYYTDKE
jgi:hypothetical protein